MASGIWQPQWKSRHINWLELQAVWLTLQHFLTQLGGHSGGGTVGHDNSILHQQAGGHSLSVAVQTSPGLI